MMAMTIAFSKGFAGDLKLSHPHIARLYDFGEMDGVLHYAMEYCGGGSLADYVAKNGPLSLRRTIEIAQNHLPSHNITVFCTPKRGNQLGTEFPPKLSDRIALT
jgi:serine/threonine protein kinase